MSDKKVLHTVGAALIDAEGRVFIQQRPEGSSYPGYWEFPGGKIDSGETPRAALKRELKEELGINASVEALFPLTFFAGDHDPHHVVNLIFGCREWSGELIPCMAQASSWVWLRELHHYELLKKNYDVVSVLEQLI